MKDIGNYSVSCKLTDTGSPSRSTSYSFNITVYNISLPPPPTPIQKDEKVVVINNTKVVVKIKYIIPIITQISNQGEVQV